MYHYSNVQCFLSYEHDSIILYINGNTYIANEYKIVGAGNNQKQIILKDLHIYEVEGVKKPVQHTKQIVFKLEEYDDLKKTIGDPVYFISLKYKDLIYDTILFGRLKLDNFHSITFTPNSIDSVPNVSSDIKSIKRINQDEIEIALGDKEALYYPAYVDKKYENIILTLTSTHKDMPSCDTLEKSLQSIKRFSFFNNSLSVIVADGIKDGSRWDDENYKEKYEQYKEIIKSKINKSEYPFDNTVLIESKEWNGPARNIKHAIDTVQCDTIFMNQHDLWFDEHDGVRANNYGHLAEDTIEKELYTINEYINKGDANCIIFPRYWEIVRRLCYCGSGISYARCCDEKENGDKGKDFKLIYDEKRVKGENLWWKFTNKDHNKGDFKLYSVQGFSDAQCLISKNFLEKVLDFSMQRNPNRFPEDIIHSIIINHNIDLFDKIYLYHIFCCFHIDLKSKNSYLGQGIDEY